MLDVTCYVIGVPCHVITGTDDVIDALALEKREHIVAPTVSCNRRLHHVHITQGVNNHLRSQHLNNK